MHGPWLSAAGCSASGSAPSTWRSMAAFALLRAPRCAAAGMTYCRRRWATALGAGGRSPGVPGRALLHVLQHPAPELREQCRPIAPEEFEEGALYPLAEEMLRLMFEHEGAGLAAPQVGLPIRLIVASPCATADPRHLLVLANPTLVGECAGEPIVGSPGVELGTEGCLSIERGDTEGQVPRWSKLRRQRTAAVTAVLLRSH